MRYISIEPAMLIISSVCLFHSKGGRQMQTKKSSKFITTNIPLEGWINASNKFHINSCCCYGFSETQK